MKFKSKVRIITFSETREEFYEVRKVLIDQKVKKVTQAFGRVQALLSV